MRSRIHFTLIAMSTVKQIIPTTALSLPSQSNNLSPCANQAHNLTTPSLVSNLTGPSRPICHPPSASTNPISQFICSVALAELHLTSYSTWHLSLYEWSDSNNDCTITLKSDKAPPEEGAIFEINVVQAAAQAVIVKCGVQGGAGTAGIGGSLGLNLGKAGEWRLWVTGKRKRGSIGETDCGEVGSA